MIDLRRTLLLAALSVPVLCLLAPAAAPEDEPATGAPFHQTVSGKGLAAEFSKAPKAKLGKRLRAVARPHRIDWFGAPAISGQIDVENPSDREIHTSIHFILFDAEGTPLGCASQSMRIEPGKETTWGGFVVKLPAAQVERIASWTYVWYEDTQAIGSR